MKFGFLPLVVNAVFKTVGFWMIFLWFSNLLLRKPLAALTTATGKADLGNLDSFRVNMKTSGKNELKVLEQSFNSMRENLNTAVPGYVKVIFQSIQFDPKLGNLGTQKVTFARFTHLFSSEFPFRFLQCSLRRRFKKC
ncbi:MAG: HAMP domain-containing protein [Nitrospinota bacterium]